MDRNAFPVLATAAVLTSALAYGTSAGQQVRTVQITPLQAMRLLARRGEYAKVKRIALADLWKDISKPQTLRHLVVALEKTGDREQAGAFCHILLGVLAQPKTATAPATPALRRWAEAQLSRLDVEFDKARRQYVTSAPARKFTTPQAVGELWMTNVHADPQCLHNLGAWKLVGGRRDMKPDWIHNRQGRMHRSCLKLMDEVDGRKGVLHAITVKPASKFPDKKFLASQIDRLGHRPRITTRNVGKCRFLRAGVKAQKFPLILRVEAEGKELLSQQVGAAKWSDLKIDLQTSAGKDVQVIVELLVPAGQRWHSGGWIDYLDFFDN